MMDRRRFLVASVAGVIAAPRGAKAQQTGKLHRVGFLAPSPTVQNVTALREGLRDSGYVEPAGLVVEIRWGDGRLDRLPGLAAELVQLRVHVIVTDSTAAALAAKHATATIPIVMGTGASDPARRGLVASLARPGGNVTGLTLPNLNGKRLEILKEAVPRLTGLGYIWNPANPGGKDDVRAVEAAARVLGLQVHPFAVKSDGDLDAAFAGASRDGVGGVVVMSDFVLHGLREHIVQLAIRHRLPGIYETKEFVEAGGLLAYGVNVPANFRRAAVMVAKILEGAKPADLPVENPARIELFLNLKTAKTLGLTIPPSLLARADQVIE
jgi:putative ABC transport system substrate-binding protein